MDQAHEDILKQALGYDPLHDGLSVKTVAAYNDLIAMNERANSGITEKDLILLAFLMRGEKPVDLYEQKRLKEGDAVTVMPGAIAKLPKALDTGAMLEGEVVEVSGGSEAGQYRVKIKGDKAKYREVDLHDIRPPLA